MDVFAVMSEVITTVKTITGLRGFAYDPGQVAPPVALAGWPDRLEYLGTYGRGMAKIPDLPLLVLVGKASGRIAAKRLGEYVAGTGARSIPAVLEARAGLWVACDVVTVTAVDFPDAEIAGVPYLAAQFHLDIAGKGI